MIINKTWNDFWGKFLMVDFHKDNPRRSELVNKRADWIWNNAELTIGSRVLDLGCGSGMLDICMAGRGANLTAIDRIESVLNIARQGAGSLPVKFYHSDIKDINYHGSSFDHILILETLGLMDKEEDVKLIRKSYNWLDKNGIIVVDSPEPLAVEAHYWKKELPNGLLTFESEYDPATQIQTINPALLQGEDTILLYDKYSTDKGDYSGVKRYLYTKKELSAIMENAGFKVEEISHYWGESYYALKGVNA